MSTTATTTTCIPQHTTSPTDRRSGYCHGTKTFRSLRPSVPLPPEDIPLSLPAFVLSLLPSPLPTHPALLDAATGDTISYPSFFSQVSSLAAALGSSITISKGDVAVVLSPCRLDTPILYCALLSLGVIVSPANHASTPPELARLVSLSNPTVAFAVSSNADKLPPNLPVILLDSPLFESFLQKPASSTVFDVTNNTVMQSDIAVIQYSSGTSGQTKAVAASHRSLIAQIAGFRALRPSTWPQITLLSAPLFHSMGFCYSLRGIALGDSIGLMTSGAAAGIVGVIKVAARYKVTQMIAAPPVVMAMAKGDAVDEHDMSALELVICGGAPLPAAAAEGFKRRFPHTELSMGYGATETGGISRMIGPYECAHLGSVGRITENVEVKIVDVVSGEMLPVDQRGELCVRGPACMTGYVGDDKANASAFDSNGWVRTGDLCYIDKDGFVFVVDRLKELIKYKAYQVPPAELEHVLQSLPEIADAAVMPYPHEEAGQIPMALVVRKPGSNITEVQIMDYVAKQVAAYKKIRKVAFVNSIPKSPSGKILRRQLPKQLLSGSLSRL